MIIIATVIRIAPEKNANGNCNIFVHSVYNALNFLKTLYYSILLNKNFVWETDACTLPRSTCIHPFRLHCINGAAKTLLKLCQMHSLYVTPTWVNLHILEDKGGREPQVINTKYIKNNKECLFQIIFISITLKLRISTDYYIAFVI